MTYQLHLFIIKSYMPQPHLSRHCYELFFVLPHYYCNLISLVPTWLSINTNSFWSRNSTYRMWAKQAVSFDSRLIREDYLQINVFSNLVLVEREEHPHSLRKATEGGATNKVVRETADWTRSCLTLGISTSASIIHHTTQWVEVTVE